MLENLYFFTTKSSLSQALTNNPMHSQPPTYNLEVLTGSSRSLISWRGKSAKSEGSGLSRSQAHFCTSSGDSEPSSISMMYLPKTGKNLKP